MVEGLLSCCPLRQRGQNRNLTLILVNLIICLFVTWHNVVLYKLSRQYCLPVSNLRKEKTFRDPTTGFPRNDDRRTIAKNP